jgi:putative ABC transport system ATP-binding protein
MALIRLEDVRKTYHLGEVDVPVLKSVSLEIERGEMVALMGASGSGKSTLMNILGCLDRPTSGTYWLDGEEVSRCTNDERATIRNRKIGLVFQNFNLLPRTSALDQVLMPLTYTNAGLGAREGHRRADALLDRVGLGERPDHEPSQQQRVAIARSLINNPPILFADEPTGNLDSKTSPEILGGVGIMNIMLVSVTERTREIGLRMAVGAKSRDIFWQFLVEAAVLCWLGGIQGIVLGRVGSSAISAWKGWSTAVSLPAILGAVGVSLLVGLAFGYYPAWKASRLDPMEALRYE